MKIKSTGRIKYHKSTRQMVTIVVKIKAFMNRKMIKL